MSLEHWTILADNHDAMAPSNLLNLFVSERVRSYFDSAFLSETKAQTSPNLQEWTLDALRGRTGCLRLWIMATPTECHDFQVSFGSFDPAKLDFLFVVLDTIGDGADFLDRLERVQEFRTSPLSRAEANWLYNRAMERFETTQNQAREDRQEALIEKDELSDLQALISIGQALTHDRNDQDSLLEKILLLSKKITGGDAGSIYLVEEDEAGQFLRFRYTHTFSKELPFNKNSERNRMPLDTNSIAGYVAVTGETLNLPDVYLLGPESPVRFNSTFDKQNGYRTKSMLVTPMVNHLGATIGVIQLMNSKEAFDVLGESDGNEAFTVVLDQPEDFEKYVVPFAPRYEELMKAVAGQAAIAIENNRMIRQIQQQFDAFVDASVRAIESRDPATSGHSFRVTSMSVGLAQAINLEHSGPLADVKFNQTQLDELRLAALLHDFGKVYIDLNVFQKAKKLMPWDLEILKTRLALLYRTAELQYLDHPEKTDYLERIHGLWKKVQELNEPSVVSADPQAEVKALTDIASQFRLTDLDGNDISVFTPQELTNLSIARGSLNDEERKIIQSHVVHTRNFVKNIPWPEEYRNIPEIASKHHEMLDGSGYPDACKAEDIPLGAQIMAVADVYDALSATDRPYKKAISLSKCLSILQEEADKGRLNRDLVELFIRRQVYEITQNAGPPSQTSQLSPSRPELVP